MTIDSHVHLYSAENNADLRWMSPELSISGEHGLAAYLKEAAPQGITGLVFLEVDVKADKDNWGLAVKEYAYVVDEFEADSTLNYKKIVPWIPLDSDNMTQYIADLKKVRGESMYDKYVSGFRYLFQDKPSGTMLKPIVLQNLNYLASLKRYTFDIGIDIHSFGVWEYDECAQMLQSVDSGLTWVFNHLGKPDYESADKFTAWCAKVEEMDAIIKAKGGVSYMKVSGGFSELPKDIRNVDKLAELVRPWVEKAKQVWGTEYLIFGSDWPVCVLNGGSIAQWLEILAKFDLSDEIFTENVCKCYGKTSGCC